MPAKTNYYEGSSEDEHDLNDPKEGASKKSRRKKGSDDDEEWIPQEPTRKKKPSEAKKDSKSPGRVVYRRPPLLPPLRKTNTKEPRKLSALELEMRRALEPASPGRSPPPRKKKNLTDESPLPAMFSPAKKRKGRSNLWMWMNMKTVKWAMYSPEVSEILDTAFYSKDYVVHFYHLGDGEGPLRAPLNEGKYRFELTKSTLKMKEINLATGREKWVQKFCEKQFPEMLRATAMFGRGGFEFYDGSATSYVPREPSPSPPLVCYSSPPVLPSSYARPKPSAPRSSQSSKHLTQGQMATMLGELLADGAGYPVKFSNFD